VTFFSGLLQELVKLALPLLAEVHPEEGFLHRTFLLNERLGGKHCQHQESACNCILINAFDI